MNISGIDIGSGSPCRFVAELSNNHNGDRDRLRRLIDAAQEADADFVKIQSYTPEELVALRGDGPAPEPWGSQGWTMRSLYEKARTPLEWLPKIAAHCERVGMPWFSSVFGLESLAALEAVGCPAYKIASLDRNSPALLASVKATGRPVLMSAPNSDYAGEVDGVLYCPPGYPTAPADVQLPAAFVGNAEWEGGQAYIGLSSHCLAPELPVAAVARGAKLLEYHFMLAEEPSELESNVSLTQYQFRDMIRSVRATEEMLG